MFAGAVVAPGEACSAELAAAEGAGADLPGETFDVGSPDVAGADGPELGSGAPPHAARTKPHTMEAVTAPRRNETMANNINRV